MNENNILLLLISFKILPRKKILMHSLPVTVTIFEKVIKLITTIIEIISAGCYYILVARFKEELVFVYTFREKSQMKNLMFSFS